MQITISGQNIDITDPLRDYVSDKLGRVQSHFDHVTNTNVVLHVEKTRHMAEGSIHAKGTQFNAHAEGADMYAAIDALADKLDRQAIKHKEKTSDHHQRDGADRKHQF